MASRLPQKKSDCLSCYGGKLEYVDTIRTLNVFGDHVISVQQYQNVCDCCNAITQTIDIVQMNKFIIAHEITKWEILNQFKLKVEFFVGGEFIEYYYSQIAPTVDQFNELVSSLTRKYDLSLHHNYVHSIETFATDEYRCNVYLM